MKSTDFLIAAAMVLCLAGGYVMGFAQGMSARPDRQTVTTNMMLRGQ